MSSIHAVGLIFRAGRRTRGVRYLAQVVVCVISLCGFELTHVTLASPPSAANIRASLVALVAGQTAFLTDPGLHGAYVGLPISVTETGYSHVVFRLVDRSPGGIPGTLALALLKVDGTLCTPKNDPLVRAELSGTQASAGPIITTAAETDARTESAEISLNGPIGGRHLLILYNGASLSRFSHATLQARFSNHRAITQRDLEISSQQRVTTPFSRVSGELRFASPASIVSVAVSVTNNGRIFGTGTPFGPEVSRADAKRWVNQIEKGGYDSSVDTNTIYAASDEVVRMYRSSGEFTGIEMPVPTYHVPRASISGIATLNLSDDASRQMVYVTDKSCASCNGSGATGVVALDADPGDGIGKDSLPGRINPVQALSNSVDFRSIGAGPLGIASFSHAQGAPTQRGSLFLAARNSIYRLDFIAAPESAGRYKVNGAFLFAGSGRPGRSGAGRSDGNRMAARFNFGADGPIGLTFDQVVRPAKALFVADSGNDEIRRIDLATGEVRTYAKLPGPPSGLTVDPYSGIVFAAIAKLGILLAVEPGHAPRIIAGSTGTDVRVDGFGRRPYPLQFESGSVVSDGSGGPRLLYRNIKLAAQAAVPRSKAKLASPMGLSFDMQSTIIVAFERGSGLMRLVR